MYFSSFGWAHLGLNQGPPDYESGATNQLSYRPEILLFSGFDFANVNNCLYICK